MLEAVRNEGIQLDSARNFRAHTIMRHVALLLGTTLSKRVYLILVCVHLPFSVFSIGDLVGSRAAGDMMMFADIEGCYVFEDGTILRIGSNEVKLA